MPPIRTVLSATAALLLAAAAEPAPAQGPADPVKGVWAVESSTFNGSKVPDDPTAGPQLTAFDGNDYVQRRGVEIVEEGSYTLDPSKSPGAIDFLIKKGPDAGKRQLGIYEVSGDTLRIALARPGVAKRPRSFEPADDQLVVVNRRFKP